MRLRHLLLAPAAAAALSSPAPGAWSSFLPRAHDNGAVLDLFGSREEDDRENGARSSEFDDTFFKEKLTLFSNGYVYHPRFLYYRLSLTGAFKQEQYRTSLFGNSTSTRGSALEYEGRVILLPEHPYNLEIFALRREPLFKEHLAARPDRVATSRGADLRYRRKPYFFHARYTDDTIELDSSSSEVRRLGINGEYFRQYAQADHFSLSGAFNPARFDRSDGLEGDSTEALFGNVLDFGRFRLDSRLSRYELSQESPLSGRLESDLFAWSEQLTLDLPAHFRSQVRYGYEDNESRFPGSRAAGRDGFSSVARHGQFQLLHRLYQSLDSSYTYRRDERDSLGGGSDSTSHALRFNYDKKIPRGSIVAGASLGRGEFHSLGRTDVAEESHPATPVPGSFPLAQANVDRASIAVFLRSPLAPFESILLSEGTHYTLTEIGDSFEVDVLALPPQFVVPGSYDFRVSYSLELGNYRLRSDTRSYSASVHLLDNLLTPFASYTEVSSEVLSGRFPGTTPDSTTRAAGLLFNTGPFRARVEYRDVQWEVGPYEEWSAEVHYVDALSPTTNLYTTATYRKRDFPRGRPGLAGVELTEQRESAAASLRQLFFGRRLSLTVGGSYSRTQALFDSRAHSANAALSWRFGRTDLTAGANRTDSDTDGIGLVSSHRAHRYYFLRLRRELF